MQSYAHLSNMNKKILTYYTFLALAVFSVAAHTVFVGSRHIDYGKRVSTLENQKAQLTAQVQRIEQHTSLSLSMTQLNQDAKLQGFIPIQSTVRVDINTVVASR